MAEPAQADLLLSPCHAVACSLGRVPLRGMFSDHKLLNRCPEPARRLDARPSVSACRVRRAPRVVLASVQCHLC